MRALRDIVGLFLLIAALGACTSSGGLDPGLSARMDQRGAALDQTAALGIINDYRRSVGVAALTLDPALNVEASRAAGTYAKSESISAGRTALGPLSTRLGSSGQSVEKVSAGYTSFAETFSGWRNSPDDAAALAASWAKRAGIAATYDAESGFGTYWVLILAE